jgi:hypothetical protein
MARVKLSDEEKRIKRNQYSANYKARNKEEVKRRQKEYEKTDEYKEKHRLKMAKLRKKYPERTKEISKESRKLNGHKYNARRRELLKTDEEFANKIKERALRYKSSGKRSIATKRRYSEKPEQFSRKAKEWREKNPDKVIQSRENHRAQNIATAARKRDNLEKPYVIAVIKRQVNYLLKTDEIPEHLIEVKKQSLELKRQLKNKNNEKDNTSANL